MAEIKRNKKTLLIALLLVLVMATGALIGTLAKYVTSSTTSDEAVVAKFGLNLPNTIDLFSDSYTNVVAEDGKTKIIAPGTTGNYTFAVTGTSEVAYKVLADIKIEYSEEWNDHAPLLFSLNGTDWKSLADFQTALSTALDSELIAANATYSSTQTIHWTWPFDVSPEENVKDTAVGIAAAEVPTPTVTITIEMTAAQVD